MNFITFKKCFKFVKMWLENGKKVAESGIVHYFMK